MSYINTRLLESYKLTLIQYSVLCILRQNKFEDQSEFLQEYEYELVHFRDNNLLEEVKAKNKQESVYKRLRISKKGQEIIDNVSIAEVNEDSLKIFDWVKSVYVKEGKEIGNAKKTKQFIAQFSKESGIERNSLAYLIQSFLSDEKEFEYSQRAEYLFYKGATLFSIKFDLYQSRLYQYYQKHQNKFDTKFKEFD